MVLIMRKLAIARINGAGIGLIIAVVSIAVAIFCGVLAYGVKEDFQAWMTARPMELSIDLSQPGKYRVPFHQTCSTSHGELIILDADIKDETGNVPEGLLDDLSASIVITDLEGKVIDQRKLIYHETPPANVRIIRNVAGEIILADLPTFQTGDYIATIIVENGLPALNDTSQTIYTRYELCGCEQLPVYSFGFASLILGTIGLISLVIGCNRLIRCGIWDSVATENVSQEPELDPFQN